MTDIWEYLDALEPDRCPRCGYVQANVNNPFYLMLLRPDQVARRACAQCGWLCSPHG